MSTTGPRILCVEEDLPLMETRCSILTQAGYDASGEELREAEILLRSQAFYLIILSATLNHAEKRRIIAAAGGKTKILASSEPNAVGTAFRGGKATPRGSWRHPT